MGATKRMDHGIARKFTEGKIEPQIGANECKLEGTILLATKEHKEHKEMGHGIAEQIAEGGN